MSTLSRRPRHIMFSTGYYPDYGETTAYDAHEVHETTSCPKRVQWVEGATDVYRSLDVISPSRCQFSPTTNNDGKRTPVTIFSSCFGLQVPHEEVINHPSWPMRTLYHDPPMVGISQFVSYDLAECLKTQTTYRSRWVD